MKKRVFALVCLLMCLWGTWAMAAALESAAKVRIDMNLPAGMVIDKEKSYTKDGEMHIVIDTYATDWDMVATAARVSNTLVIHPGIHAPEGAQGKAEFTDYSRGYNETLAQAEQRIASQFDRTGLSAGKNGDRFACSYQGMEIGRFDEGTGLFLPKELTWGQGFAVRWRMADQTNSTGEITGGVFRNERVRVYVTYSDLQPVYLKRQKVNSDDIAGNVNTGGSGMVNPSAVLSVEKSSGKIVYVLKNDAAGREVFTAVAAPDWANAAYLISNGEETPLTMNDGAYISGKSSAVLFYKVSKQDCLYKKDWAIKWVNTKTQKFDVYALEAEFHVGNPNLTVTYDRYDRNNNLVGKKATPLAYSDNGNGTDDSIRWSFRNPLDGLGAEYQDGVLHLTVNEKELPPNRKIDLSRTELIAQVKAPAGAAYCNVYLYKGDVIYGNNGEGDRMHNTIAVTSGEFFTVPEMTRGYFMPCYYTLHNGKQICYYAPKAAVGKDGGEVVIFEWLNADKEPLSEDSREFVAFTAEGYDLFVRRNQSLDEKAGGDDPKVLAIDAADQSMNVETAIVPQTGDNIMRYEIVLYDNETGEKADPDHPVLLYLPYPDGKTAEEAMGDEFIVYHPRKDGSYEEFSVANGNLTLTPYGLCMEVTSFSPYYLSWEEAVQTGGVADLPQTGDRSNLALWLLMAAGALTACMSLKKKNAA